MKGENFDEDESSPLVPKEILKRRLDQIDKF